MSDRSMPTSTNPLSKPQLPSFVEMLGVSQKNLIKALWNVDHLSISDKIDSIDSISKDMPKEARVEYRKWRFLMDRSKMPDFYDSQNNEIKMVIAGMLDKSTDLEEFARIMTSIKPALNNPDAFDKWMKNEEIEFKKGAEIPLVNSKMNELARNSNNLQIDGGNSHKNLFYYLYSNNRGYEGRICLLNSHNFSIEEIAKFHGSYNPYHVATTQNKIFGIDRSEKSFEIFDLNTRQISRGPDPPEWRKWASVAYYKDKLYYLGGYIPETWKDTSRVDVLIDGQWQTGPAFPLPTHLSQAIICDGILYVIDVGNSRKIYRLLHDEREWIEVGKISEKLDYFGIASLNGKIYITGGSNYGVDVFKSCLCFDPSAPDGSRIYQIASMTFARNDHSLIVANGKLYAIGGFQERLNESFCDSIEEYDPQKNKWREVGKLKLE